MRLYDASDEPDDAATLLHRSAKPPQVEQQEHTAPIPAAHAHSRSSPLVPLQEAVVRPREPIPFEQPVDPEPKVLLLPLVVGFLIFAIGLAFYIWAR